MHSDLTRPVPKTEFLTDRIRVAHPSGEPLVCMNDRFSCSSYYNSWPEIGGRPLPGSSPVIRCRKTVFEMLEKAESILPEGLRFLVLDAYRAVDVQQALWDHYRAIFAAEHPDASPEELDRITLFCVARPSRDVLLPSLHNTGGAVDLTLIGADGKMLDMGTDFDEFTPRAWTCWYEDGEEGSGVDITVRDNRRILYNVMTSAGFTNLPSEWWHYDYGDEKWALYTKNAPLYGGIPDDI